MLTLFTTPVVYLYLDRFSNRMRQRRHARAEAKQEAAHPESPDSDGSRGGEPVTTT
jgi:hypothetical protein